MIPTDLDMERKKVYDIMLRFMVIVFISHLGYRSVSQLLRYTSHPDWLLTTFRHFQQ